MSARVVIVGGGIAGLEAALALRDLAGERADITLVSPEPDFTMKPLVVEEPFTNVPAERHDLAAALSELEIGHVVDAVRAVHAEANEVELAGGDRLAYDTLVVCIGGRARPVYESAETFWSTTGDLPIDSLIERAAGSGQPLALIAPPGTTWPLPLYELALMTRRRAEELGHGDLPLTVYTTEDAPLSIFGSVASEAVAALLAARAIEVRTGSYVAEDDGRELHLVPSDERLGTPVAIALPAIEGPHVEGLPADEHGFIPVDRFGRVEGAANVFAAGDGTNFPVKQGGLATQQADAAAERIAADLGANLEPHPFEPVLRGQLITGADSLHLKHGLSGGHGEGAASLDYLWWPPKKVSGRYLSAWLAREPARPDLEPPFQPIEVEASWPHEWHGEPL
jgi:sulfide:quinone oxidoreductase